jgi:malate dehydrogenase (oxaloacetate-decarboxylating)(NADP+)
VVFAEADNIKILKAAQIVMEEGIATPILLGNREKIEGLLRDNSIDLGDVYIIDPLTETERVDSYGKTFFSLRQ